MKENFTKSDLKTGMWIELRNGEKAMVLLNTTNGDIYSGQTWGTLSDYNDDLTHKDSIDKIIDIRGFCKFYGITNFSDYVKKYDIIKIYNPISESKFINNNIYEFGDKVTLVWESK